MKKVNVLLSTYNGEKYIREQIDSILNQTWENLTLYVRDDGSSDNTIEILREYEESGQIILDEGDNVGFIKSFFSLIKKCDEADYYAFADQDDSWFPNKLEYAVEMMEKENEKLPLLYFSNYDFYDKNMKFMAHSNINGKTVNTSFANCLVDCIPLGFNMLFNNTTRKSIIEHFPKYSCGHDWWVYMVCQGMGKVIYDERVTVAYRRHDNNVSIGGKGFIGTFKWRFKKFFIDDYFACVRKMLREYAYLYQRELDKKDRKLLFLFARKKNNIINSLIKTFYPVRFRQNVLDEIFVRIIFLLGRL